MEFGDLRHKQHITKDNVSSEVYVDPSETIFSFEFVVNCSK